LNRAEFKGLKIMRIRDVVEHADVGIPNGTTFTTKTVKMHGVAHYVFTLGESGDLESKI
jgi:hypothetical protein